MNTALELTGVALAALLSENLVLVSCMGIGTHEKSFQEPREAIRTGCCLTVVMILGALGAWLLNYLVLLRYGLTHFQVLAFALLVPGLVAALRKFLSLRPRAVPAGGRQSGLHLHQLRRPGHRPAG